MRILHVGDDFAALRRCGLTLYTDALMQGQVASGHDVSYVFSGRHYPRLPRPRLKRWGDRGVRMYELIGSPNQSHPEAGTRHPELDVAEPAGEAAFAAALRESRPDLVHVHELGRLPSSVIEQAKGAGLPVVMSLYDYKPLCASVRLLDADGQRCTRREVGEDCARNCAGAPEGAGHLVEWTLRYERERLRRAVPQIGWFTFGRVGLYVDRAIQLVSAARDPGAGPDGDAPAPAAATSPPGEYQRRRDVNVRRLGLCDRLLACSHRLAELYAELGVDDRRMTVHQLTLPHLEQLTPARGPEVGSPLTFVALGACGSPSKGSRLVRDAVRRLVDEGREDDFRLLVVGPVEEAVHDELAALPCVSLRGFTSAGTYGVEDVLDEADVGLMPSIWEEAYGFVGVEMLAKGVPVIGNALGGITEYVRDGETGWLNRSATADELAGLMARAIDDRDEVERLRRSVRAGRGRIVRPMRAHLAEMERVYAELR